ncbi:hypothetical protein ZWY2020_055132 [Hordeum vulgare]|nr:hypothetical protein ZWY2020_055132 [Hordeum vulgare]
MEETAAACSSDNRISFQTSLPSHSDSGMQLQVVEYAATATATATHDICSETVQVFEEVTQVFNEKYFLIMEEKMHKFPPSLVDVPDWYKVPATVAIGPYYHGKPGLLAAEQVKHSAANQCIRDSPVASLQEMYNAVFAVLPDALNLYYQDELAKFRHDDLLPMMFIDACFLVQFMRWYYLPEGDMHQALESYFSANYERICTDIMMLENQIPWVVVKTIFNLMPPAPSPWLSPWERFVIVMRRGLGNQNSAVCSYLHLFAMLLDQKQDVHELQKEHVIEGGGLTSKLTLEFFASIGKNMRPGTFYLHTIKRIGKFRTDMSSLLRFILFLKRKRAKIMALISIIAAVVGILSSLKLSSHTKTCRI